MDLGFQRDEKIDVVVNSFFFHGLAVSIYGCLHGNAIQPKIQRADP